MFTSTGPPTPPVAPAFPAAEPPARVRVPGYNIELDLTMVRSKFNMRIDDAATDIGIPLSALKIACRQLGIARWPRRVKPRRNVPVAGPQSAQARDLAPAAGRQDNPLSSASSGEDSPRGVPMQAASTEGGIAISSDRSIVSRWSRVNAQTGGLLDWALDELGDCKVETRRGGGVCILTAQEVVAIFLARKERSGRRDQVASRLALKFRVAPRTVRDIWNLRTWT